VECPIFRTYLDHLRITADRCRQRGKASDHQARRMVDPDAQSSNPAVQTRCRGW
jgi:hypothetical protein